MIVCAGEVESFKFATPVGIGLIDSAINLTNLLTEKLPKELIFVGTAGLYKDGEILKIYESSSCVQHEISNLDKKSYSPIMARLTTDVSRETIIANSSNFITTDKISAYKFANLGYFLENMEFYSILRVANFFKIPAYGIFCSTNFCDEFAHIDFLKNHKNAKILIEEYVKKKGII
ncbi:purine-nucleoside phosphorylase [Campylobacter geochelonis]|uniref:Purine nucleoside phosphorylase n=1 Tax=Campylobacter geochelonis TaxID=1780362 RepID=A0A128ENC1_9BACT|nr:purine-nucleoside phosphorylase [Campylobacter geochelonis]QKF70448.1 putative nucleoside phosphorylase [Campylobacter geochelonis]CZE46268.1 purine nucleoside phosphorylase [Campylobacter geochelonis]CZE46366.1 purine nucleoside phosphorylase [Campylobacter geochelonis]CZE50657.1 purine nucleoside phosphorylase [Campylobacter geochelonis]